MSVANGRCLNCDEQGPHFIAPSMGKFGYYSCEDELLQRGRSAKAGTQAGPVGGATGQRKRFPYEVSNLAD